MYHATDTAARTPDLREAKRILVIGSGGAGKSTLALRLGESLGIEVIHLDRAYWRSGWKETPRREWEATVRRLAGQDAWIMDGNYGSTLDIRLVAADAVIFLDLPRSLCIRRVVTRRFRYARRSRPDMTSGCPERLTFQFLRYLWNYPVERRPGILQKLEQASSGRTVVVLRSTEEVDRLLADLEDPLQGPRSRRSEPGT